MILVGDCRKTLRTLDAGSARTCITSPPYFGLRDYGHPDQIGLEETPEAYVENIVAAFRAVRRVLADDGTVWLNIGDSYAHGGCGARDAERWPKQSRNDHLPKHAKKLRRNVALKPKDLIGIPWMVAFALRADGWYLRSDIVWSKPNPMPESVADRPTKAHEYVFLLSKSEQYFYDADAIREPHKRESLARYEYGLHNTTDENAILGSLHERRAAGLGGSDRMSDFMNPAGRNKRTVWAIASEPCDEAHFAVMPSALVVPCILAGSALGDTVLDPFGGSGTVARVAAELGRKAITCELNPEYAKLIERRTAQGGLFANTRTGR